MFTLTTDKDGRPYCYHAVAPYIKELLDVKIERYSISKESQEQIIDLLKIKEAPTENVLRGIRNAVVEILSGVAEVMFDKAKNKEEWLSVSRSIGAITAVIDKEMYNRGYMEF